MKKSNSQNDLIGDENEFALQQINEMCGAQALFLAAKISGKSISYTEITALLGDPQGGFAISEIEEAADKLGLSIEVGRMTVRDFMEKAKIVILRIPQTGSSETGHHYFVLNKLEGSRFLLYNPPFSVSSYTIRDGKSRSYEGIAVSPIRAETKHILSHSNLFIAGVSLVLVALFYKKLRFYLRVFSDSIIATLRVVK